MGSGRGLVNEDPAGNFSFIFIPFTCHGSVRGSAELNRAAGLRISGRSENDDIAVQQRLHLLCGDTDHIVRTLRFLEQLVRIKEDLGAESLAGGLPRIFLKVIGERPCDQGRDQHDDKCHRIFRLIGVEAELRLNEEPVEQQHGCERTEGAVNRIHRKHSDDQDSEDKDSDDIRFREPKEREQQPDTRSGGKEKEGNEGISPRQADLADRLQLPALLLYIGRGVRNNIDIHVRRIQYDLLRQRGLAPEVLPFCAAPAHDDLRGAGDVGVFRDLDGNIISDDRRDLGAVLLRKADIALEAAPVRLRQGVIVGGLHIDGCQRRMKGLRHLCGGIYHFPV